MANEMREMEVHFIPNQRRDKTQLLQINNASLRYRNFKGEKRDFNNEGDRNFSVYIPTDEIAEALRNDVNEFGVGWKVKIRAPRNEEDVPMLHMPVKVKYTDRSAPKVYLRSGDNCVELNENTIGMLDDIRIAYCDLDIRPYDGEGRFGPHRTAYLQSIWVVQDLTGDRFASRMRDVQSNDWDEEDYD